MKFDYKDLVMAASFAVQMRRASSLDPYPPDDVSRMFDEAAVVANLFVKEMHRRQEEKDREDVLAWARILADEVDPCEEDPASGGTCSHCGQQVDPDEEDWLEAEDSLGPN